MGSLFFVPTIIFLVVVAPVWLVLHYWSKRKMDQGLSDEDRQVLEEALALVDKLEDRVRTLERILDSDHQGWRDSHESASYTGTDPRGEER